MAGMRPQTVLCTARRALAGSSSGSAGNGARPLSVAAWRRFPQTEGKAQAQTQASLQPRRALSTAAAGAGVPSASATQTRSYASAAAASSSLPGSLVQVLSLAASVPSSVAGSPSSVPPLVARPSPTLHPAVYATVLLHGRPYLVTPGDRLRLPFRMAGVRPGDELRLDRVGVVGTRSVTAVGTASQTEDESKSKTKTHLSGQTPETRVAVPGASVTAVVLGVETEPLRILIKKKRRCRRKRSVRSKHQYTVLRIQDVVVEAV